MRFPLEIQEKIPEGRDPMSFHPGGQVWPTAVSRALCIQRTDGPGGQRSFVLLTIMSPGQKSDSALGT